MCVDVIDVGGRHAGALHRHAHAAKCAIAILGRGRDVIGIAGQAVAHDFSINLRAALFRVLVFLEHHDAGALAHHETITVLVVRPRCDGRIVIVLGGHRAQRTEAAHGQPVDG